MSPGWKGYLANTYLESLSETFDVSALHIPDECELQHSLGEIHEVLLDKNLLSVNSSLSTTLESFDVQVLMSSWQEAWSLLLPDAINIVIGSDGGLYEKCMLANCFRKVNVSNIYTGAKLKKIPENSQFSKIPIKDQGFKFIYPETFTSITKPQVEKWIGDVDELSGKRVVIYYPEPYCDPQALAVILESMNLDNIDIDIVASPESVESITAVLEHENCKQRMIEKHIGMTYPEFIDDLVSETILCTLI